MTHGDSEELVNSLLNSGDYDIVLRGHNHVAEIKKNDRTLLINPGCLIEGKKWTKPSIAIYDLGKNSAKIIKL